MRILAINGTGRPEGTTVRLVDQALAGAAALGALTEHVLLCQLEVNFCTNCLTCYKNLADEIAPCAIKDDVAAVLEKIRDADGVIFASPVHSGFVTGLMTTFMERATWTLCRPTGSFFDLRGCPEPRLTSKARVSASILSAGGIPPALRQFCDQGTPWLKDAGSLMCNGEFVGDLYAGACYPREVAEEEWPRAYMLRELTEEQLQQARDLGADMARRLSAGDVKPYDVSAMEAIYAAQFGQP